LKGRDLDCTFQLFTSEHRQRADLVCFEVGDITSGIFRMTERDEIKIAQGAMLLSHATVKEHMQRQDAVTLDNVYMLEENRELNPETLREIENKGHSRILVYQGNMHNVRGFILTKQLITLYAGDAGKELLTKSWVRVSAVNLQQLIVAPPDTKMLDLLNKFQEERRHIALISNNPEAVDSAWRNKKEIPPHVHMIGIITLEDVIERLLQEKIDDEFDTDKLGSLKGGVLRRQGTTNQAPAKVVRSLSWQDGDSKRNLAEPLLP
jgi:CBS domain containing-hemolysin-like protein